MYCAHAISNAFLFSGAPMEIRRPFGNPFDEPRDLRVSAQRHRRVVGGGEFPLAEHAVYLAVTDGVDQYCFPPALRSGHQMVFLGLRTQGS